MSKGNQTAIHGWLRVAPSGFWLPVIVKDFHFIPGDVDAGVRIAENGQQVRELHLAGNEPTDPRPVGEQV
ncbi:MAG TPA: hypothetical protein VHY09_04590 [Candidatus Methylacidiphilales bacterium]|jgi:hypothetical protein|nr:hypothetical protein [Candidatus Methylacidiphilales bacterium]